MEGYIAYCPLASAQSVIYACAVSPSHSVAELRDLTPGLLVGLGYEASNGQGNRESAIKQVNPTQKESKKYPGLARQFRTNTCCFKARQETVAVSSKSLSSTKLS